MLMAIERPVASGFMSKISPHRRVMTYWSVIVAVAMIVIGGGSLYFSSPDKSAAWSLFAANVGGILVATGLISLIWELASKRLFLSEIFSVAELSEDIRRSGLARISTDFHQDLDWSQWLASATTLDVFFAYARTWRNTNRISLQGFARRSGSRMTLILPDPDNIEVMSQLERRFAKSAGSMKDLVNETIDEFTKIFDKKDGAKGRLEIFLTGVAPVFAFYRIDCKNYVITTYTHRDDKAAVPTIVCDRTGGLTDFIDREFDYLTDESKGHTRKPDARSRASADSAC